MKIISWNVNGIRAVKEKGFFEWLAGSQADIVCVQETKAQPEQLTKDFHEVPGYHVYWASAVKKGYSGVAIYSKIEPKSVNILGDDRFDSEGRTLIADYGSYAVVNCYFPNSQDAGARLDYKLAFCETLLKKLNELVASGKEIILVGDYNIAHKPIDLEHPKTNEKNAGYLPEERAWMDLFTSGGYIDTFREFHPEPKRYSWWSYRLRAREKNVGWRIDYVSISPKLRPYLKEAEIMDQVFGSDHCPVWANFDFGVQS